MISNILSVKSGQIQEYCIGDVIVSLLASSAADRWVEPNQTIKLVLAASPLSTLH